MRVTRFTMIMFFMMFQVVIMQHIMMILCIRPQTIYRCLRAKNQYHDVSGCYGLQENLHDEVHVCWFCSFLKGSFQHSAWKVIPQFFFWNSFSSWRYTVTWFSFILYWERDIVLLFQVTSPTCNIRRCWSYTHWQQNKQSYLHDYCERVMFF